MPLAFALLFYDPMHEQSAARLAAGKHTIRFEGDADDKPTIFFRPAADRTTRRSCADDLIRRYRDVTGVAPLLLKWAYGFIQSRARYYTQKELLDTLQTYRDSNCRSTSSCRTGCTGAGTAGTP